MSRLYVIHCVSVALMRSIWFSTFLFSIVIPFLFVVMCQKMSPWQHLAVVILSASRLAMCHCVHLPVVTALIGLSFGKDNFFLSVLKVLFNFATLVIFNFVILYNSDSGRHLSSFWDLKSLCCCMGDKKDGERWLCLVFAGMCICSANMGQLSCPKKFTRIAL